MSTEVTFKVDMDIDEASAACLNLQNMLLLGADVSLEADEKTKHVRGVTVSHRALPGSLRPLFDYGYTLRARDGLNQMSWADDALYYEDVVLLYSLALLTKPLHVLETGAGLGLSTIHLSRALLDNQKGRLYSIENDAELVRRLQPALNEFGFKEHTTLVLQDSLTFLKQWEIPLDLVVLDSDGPAVSKNTPAEFQIIAPLIKPLGLVITRHPLSVLTPDDEWNRLMLSNRLFVYQKRLKVPATLKPELVKKTAAAAKKTVKDAARGEKTKFKPKQRF